MSSKVLFTDAGNFAPPTPNQSLRFLVDDSGGAINHVFNLKFSVVGLSVTIFWGDGTNETGVTDGSGDVQFTKNYQCPSAIIVKWANANITTLYADTNNFTSIPTLSENTALVHLSLFDNSLTSIDTAPFPLLEEYLGFGNSLTTVDISNNPLLTDFEVNDCNLSVLAVSNAVVQLAANGLLNGTCDISNQTPAAPLNGAGLAAKTTLEAAGWTVTV